MSQTKPVIIQHVSGFDQIGGPANQLQRIINSRLKEKYTFAIVSQDRPAEGINMGLILEMAREMKKYKPDLIHIRGLQNEGFHGMIAAYLSGCRNILLSIHGFTENGNVRNPASKWILSNLLEPITLILAKQVYCVCEEAMRHKIISKFAQNKCTIIYNGIETTTLIQYKSIRQQFNLQNDEVVALFTGRLSRDKGLFVLAQALDRIINPPVVWIAGEGPDQQSVMEAFKLLSERGKVRFLGRRGDIPALISSSDFFVLPSFHENFSNSLLEAMLGAKAVITTSVGGNPELVIDGVTGFIIPPHDPDALAGKIAYLSENKKVRDEMGKNGRARVEQYFSLEQTLSKLEGIYDEMLSRKDPKK